MQVHSINNVFDIVLHSLYISHLAMEISLKDSWGIILSLLGSGWKWISQYVGRTLKTVWHNFWIYRILSKFIWHQMGNPVKKPRWCKFKEEDNAKKHSHCRYSGSKVYRMNVFVRQKKQYFYHHIAEGNCMHKIMSPCGVKVLCSLTLLI